MLCSVSHFFLICIMLLAFKHTHLIPDSYVFNCSYSLVPSGLSGFFVFNCSYSLVPSGLSGFFVFNCSYSLVPSGLSGFFVFNCSYSLVPSGLSGFFVYDCIARIGAPEHIFLATICLPNSSPYVICFPSIHVRTSLRCLLSIPTFFCQAVVW